MVNPINKTITFMEDLFFQGILSIDFINSIDKVKEWKKADLDSLFFTHMRSNENLSRINSIKNINESQLQIIKWLELYRCKNKNCVGFHIKVPVSVKKTVGGPTCQACATRKTNQKRELRFRKKVVPITCQDEEGFLCPVCYDNVECGEGLSQLPCGHCFHPECVKYWIVNNKDNCPNCRLELHLDLLNLNMGLHSKNKSKNKKGRGRSGKKNSKKSRTDNPIKQINQIKQKNCIFRKHITKQNIYARSKILRTNGGFYYSNCRGFNYKRDNAVFPDYRVVSITPPILGGSRKYSSIINEAFIWYYYRVPSFQRPLYTATATATAATTATTATAATTATTATAATTLTNNDEYISLNGDNYDDSLFEYLHDIEFGESSLNTVD